MKTIYDFNWIVRDEHGLLYGFHSKPKRIDTGNFIQRSFKYYPIKGEERTLIPETSREFGFIHRYQLIHVSEVGKARKKYYEENEK